MSRNKLASSATTQSVAVDKPAHVTLSSELARASELGTELSNALDDLEDQLAGLTGPLSDSMPEAVSASSPADTINRLARINDYAVAQIYRIRALSASLKL